MTELQGPAADLARCRAMADVAPEALVSIGERCTRRRFAAGDVLIRQGERGDSVLLLIAGRATAILENEGERQQVGEFAAYELLGEISLLTGEPRTADVVAEEDGEALVLSTRDFEELRALHPEIGVVITNLVAARLGFGSADGLAGKVVGGHRIRRCLGKGGMAIVYEAEELATGRTVALKMMSHRLIYEAGATARFQREADLLGQMEHANIVRVNGRFSAHKTWFLAMEFCDGADLSVLVKNGYRPEGREVRRLIGQLAAGLAYLHGRGVLHRDLKPHNVLVTRAGELKLGDFGLARLLAPPAADALTLPGTLIGTPHYMAPELIEGQAAASPASDIYGLGCTLLHLLTGVPPFLGCSIFEIAERKRTCKLPSRRQLGNGKLWGGLERKVYGLLKACLAADPAERRVDLAELSAWSAPLTIPPAHFDRRRGPG